LLGFLFKADDLAVAGDLDDTEGGDLVVARVTSAPESQCCWSMRP